MTSPDPFAWQGLFSIPPWGSTFHSPYAGQYGRRLDTAFLKAASLIPINSLGTDDGTTVTLNVANSTVSGYDFRNRRIVMAANNITITSCLFDEQKKVVGNPFSLFKPDGISGLLVDHCTFAGNKDATDFRNVFIDSRAGSITVQYCEAYCQNEDFLQFQEGSAYRNYIHEYGYGTNNHADAIQVYKQTGPITIAENYIDCRKPADATSVNCTSGIRLIGEQSNLNAIQVLNNVIWGNPSWYCLGLCGTDPYGAINCLLQGNWLQNTDDGSAVYPITTTGVRTNTTYINNANLSTGDGIVGTEDVPSITSVPTISWTKDGSPGSVYTVTPGSYVNCGAPSYQWYRVSKDGVTQTAILGATGMSYVSTSADVGCKIRVVEDSLVYQQSATTIGWVLAAPQVLWNVNNTAGTTNNASGIVTYGNNSTTVDGYGAIQATLTGAANGTYLQKTNLATDVPANLDVLAYCVILDTDPEYQTITGIDFRPGVGSTYYTGASRATTVHSTVGKYWHATSVQNIATFKDLGSSAIHGRLFLTSSSGTGAPYCAQPRLAAVVAKAGGIPTAVLTFDDGRFSIHDWVLPALSSRGLVANFFAPVSNLDGVSFMSLAQVKDLFNAGWGIGIDGMPDDSRCIDALDMVTVMAGIDTSWGVLAANGMDSPEKFHGCWPNGALRNAGTPVQLTGVTFNGTTTVTCASTAGVGNGINWKCAAYGMPRGTYIVSVTNSTTLVLSNAVTSTATVMSATNAGNAFYDNKLPSAFRSKGMRSMRQTNGGDMPTRFGLGERDMQVLGNSMSNSGGDNTAALMNARVETAKKNKTTTVSYAHNAVDTIVSGLDTLKTELSAHYDYLAGEVQAQRIQVLTMGQLFARDGFNAIP